MRLGVATKKPCTPWPVTWPGVVVGEGVQQVPVVGDLVAVDVHDRGELAGQPGGGR